MIEKLEVVNQDRASVLAERVVVADRFRPGLRGLFTRSEGGGRGGLLLTRCHGVCTDGMPFKLDIAFLDRSGCVVAVYHRLEPGERTKVHPRAWFALELPEGTLEETGTGCGDRLSWHTTEGRGAGSGTTSRRSRAGNGTNR